MYIFVPTIKTIGIMKNVERVALRFKNYEYKCGTVIENSNQKTLVKFDAGYTRWCKTSNLRVVKSNTSSGAY